MRNTIPVKGSLTAAGLALVGLLVLTACGLEEAATTAVDDAASQAQDAVGQIPADAATATVGAAVEQSLAEVGYTVTEPPTCSPDLSASGARLSLSGQVSCEGETSTGASYEAAFDGLITLQGRCPGSLQVDIVGDPAVSLEKIDVCRVARLLEGG
jgi:hypothetical protein